MAIVSGGQVLLGNDPGYYVIDWLPIYNFSIGAITFFVTSIVIWKNSKYALPAALATLGVHSLVMIILQTAFRDVVASESIRAMTIRMAAWLLILVLLVLQTQKNKLKSLQRA